MKKLMLLAVVVCAGCATGGVDRDVIDMFRSTSAGGSCHIEFDANGNFLEAGAEVSTDRVPAHCRAAVEMAYPGGTVTGAGRVRVPGRTDWMVAKTIDGRDFEILVSADGTVRGGEEVLAQADWPAAVTAAAMAAVPGAQLERIERVTGDEAVGAELYHVKLNENGDSIRVGVSADATVVRVVRRQASQVRFPR